MENKPTPPVVPTLEERITADVVLVKNEIITLDSGEIEEGVDPTEKIELLETEGLSLKTNGPDDREAYDLVRNKRLEIKRIRIRVEKRSDELKEDAITYQKKINKVKSEIVSKLKAIESHLASEESKVDEAIELRKAEELRAKAELIAVRTKTLTDRGFNLVAGIYHYTSPYGNGTLEYGSELVGIVSDNEFKAFIQQVIATTEADTEMENDNKQFEEKVVSLIDKFKLVVAKRGYQNNKNICFKYYPATQANHDFDMSFSTEGKSRVDILKSIDDMIEGSIFFIKKYEESENSKIEEIRKSVLEQEQKAEELKKREAELKKREAELKIQEQEQIKASKEQQRLRDEQTAEDQAMRVAQQLKFRKGLVISSGGEDFPEEDRLVFHKGSVHESGIIQYSILNELSEEMFKDFISELPMMKAESEEVIRLFNVKIEEAKKIASIPQPSENDDSSALYIEEVRNLIELFLEKIDLLPEPNGLISLEYAEEIALLREEIYIVQKKLFLEKDRYTNGTAL